MNGAEALVRTLMACDVDTCFTNPGTSEIYIVAALDRIPELRSVLTLFEGVATGAADGYARMAEKPACTLLHLGPGLANGLANLHNAYRAQVPIVNIVGQHATFHLEHDTPLTSDIEAIARPFSHWLRTSSATATVGMDAAAAVAASRAAPGKLATLIVPADVSWSEGAEIGAALPTPEPRRVPAKTVERASELLRERAPSALLMTGNALYGRGLIAAAKVAAGTGSKLFCPYPLRRLQRGAGLPRVDRVNYVLEQAVEQLKEIRQLILVGTQVPRAYFASVGKDSLFIPPECVVQALAEPGDDYVAALEDLVAALSLETQEPVPTQPERPALPSGSISLPRLAAVIGALLPEHAIVVDESMTSGRGLMAATYGAPPHEWLGNTGGSIGIALPLAVGAAIASPDRRVLCLTADGSAMYTPQALWTTAREGLNITTVVFANRDYAVLKREFSYLRVGDPGPRARDLFEIGRPDLDWVHLATGMGVPASRINSLDEFARTLKRGFELDGPTLIEVPL